MVVCRMRMNGTRSVTGYDKFSILLPWKKKRTILHEECCSSCDIMLDHERSAQGKVIDEFLPCAACS